PWIESATHPLHGFQIGLAEHFRHGHFLVCTDAVLAGDRTARRDANFQDAVRQRLRRFFLPGDGPIVKDQWMKIAVPGMKNIRDANSRLRAEVLDFAHHPWQRRAWYHSI